MITSTSGVERFTFEYFAYPHQKAFHESRARYRLLGGAAGPGKTFALLMDQMLFCNSFPRETAPEVHTLLLRRTYPKLEATVITRFREKIPKELYRDFNETKGVVTWHNGATTKFGAMQYEHDVWGYQGQWARVAYDELTEFAFSQWQNISAWNRCPVSELVKRDGATNPIGVGAQWVENLFVKKRPCEEMDKSQRDGYVEEKYAYFPATYLDNPIYATNQSYIDSLDSYQGPISQALKLGIWGVGGGYFDGAWDEAYNVYPADSVEIQPWWDKWLGGDWGFDHNSAIYWLATDELGITRVYRELVCNKHTPEELAERIVSMSVDREGRQENLRLFSFAHDAFAQKHDVNPIGLRIGKVMTANGLPAPVQSTKDKRGREQIIYDMLKGRVRTGEIFNDAEGKTEPVLAAKLQIADTCERLINVLPTAPRDEKHPEEIASFLGDDPIPGLGYPLYAVFGRASSKPWSMQLGEKLAAIPHDDSYAFNFFRTIAQAEKDRPKPMSIKRPIRR